MSFFQTLKNGISKVRVAGLAGMALAINTLAPMVQAQTRTFAFFDPMGQAYSGNCYDQLTDNSPTCDDYQTRAQLSAANGGCAVTATNVTMPQTTPLNEYSCVEYYPDGGRVKNWIQMFQASNSSLNLAGKCLSDLITSLQNTCNTQQTNSAIAIGGSICGGVVLVGLYCWCTKSKRCNDGTKTNIEKTDSSRSSYRAI